MKKFINYVGKIISCILVIIVVIFFSIQSFPGIKKQAAIKIRSLEFRSTAIIDSINIGRNKKNKNTEISFYYNFKPEDKDTLLYGKTVEEHFNIFNPSASKLKAKYTYGDKIFVYYKINKRGKYVSKIYPDTSFFNWNTFPFSGFLEYFFILYIFSFCILFFKNKNFKKNAILSLSISGPIFIFLWFVYVASPKLQEKIFRKTHTNFVEVKVDRVKNWEVLYIKDGRKSPGHYYITAEFEYSFKEKKYTSTIAPIHIYYAFLNKKIAQEEKNKFIQNHNLLALVDSENPEYAILFANTKPVYLKSTILFSFLGTLLTLISFIFCGVLLVIGLKKIKSYPKIGDLLFIITVTLLAIVIIISIFLLVLFAL